MIRIPNIDLRHGDCMDLLRSSEDNAWELAIVDPPYGINAEQGTNRASRKMFKNKEYGWDSGIPSKDYFDQLRRVSKNQIIWGGNYFLDYLGNTRSFIVWDKLNPDRCFADCEFAWCSFDEVARIFKPMRVQELNKIENGKIHPTQKPYALYKWLLTNYAKPGDRILDTHGGSMSIAIAAYDLGFDLTLTELDPDYYRDGVARFERHRAQGQLFHQAAEPLPEQIKMQF